MSGVKSSGSHMAMASECAHHGIREIVNGAGRRRWEVTCAHCFRSASCYRADVHDAAPIINHFAKAKWVLARKSSPFCSLECSRTQRAIEMELRMSSPIKEPPPVQAIGPNPVIMRRVITLLNDQFDIKSRLYREGWSDARVAKEAETSPDFVVTFRRSAYGELAEDPMISRLRDDVAALKELLEQEATKFRMQFEAQIKELDYKLARLIGQHNKASG